MVIDYPTGQIQLPSEKIKKIYKEIKQNTLHFKKTTIKPRDSPLSPIQQCEFILVSLQNCLMHLLKKGTAQNASSGVFLAL